MKACALTDIGRVRPVNQDCRFATTEPIGPLSNLFIVADGMGGHKAGDRASRLLIESLTSYIRNCSARTPVEALNHGIAEANREIYEASLEHQELAGMGSTLVAATIEDSTLYDGVPGADYQRQP